MKGVIDGKEGENLISFKEFSRNRSIQKVAKPKECLHEKVEVDSVNRNVFCMQCGKFIDPIEVLLSLADKSHRFHHEMDALRKYRKALIAWRPYRRVTKKIDEMIRKNVMPACPCCGKRFPIDALVKK